MKFTPTAKESYMPLNGIEYRIEVRSGHWEIKADSEDQTVYTASGDATSLKDAEKAVQQFIDLNHLWAQARAEELNRK